MGLLNTIRAVTHVAMKYVVIVTVATHYDVQQLANKTTFTILL